MILSHPIFKQVRTVVPMLSIMASKTCFVVSMRELLPNKSLSYNTSMIISMEFKPMFLKLLKKNEHHQ